MKIELHALLLASAALFVGAQASANQTGPTRVATLQTRPTVSREKGAPSLSDQCLALSQTGIKEINLFFHRAFVILGYQLS